jgi:hypothetical protein
VNRDTFYERHQRLSRFGIESQRFEKRGTIRLGLLLFALVCVLPFLACVL